MPKVIRTRNLISAGEVEIPDQVLPVPMEIPADPEEGAEAPEAQAAPQPDPEQTRRAAEELFRSRLEHKRYHEEYKRIVAGILNEFEQGGATVALVSKTNQAIAGWLLNHIKKEDVKVAAHIRSKCQD